MMRQLYDLIFLLFAVVSLPKFLLRLSQASDSTQMWRERRGWLASRVRQKCTGNVLWLHAVSVGEVLALRKFIHQFLMKYSDWTIALSVSTPTGHSVAKHLISDRLTLFYAPFDFSGAVRRVLDTIQPKLVLLMETEIWPNLITEVSRRQIPIGIVNGRISPRAFRRYFLATPWIGPLLQKLSFCWVQSARDADHFIKLGMPRENVMESGNLKFDQDLTQTPTSLAVFQNWIERAEQSPFVLIGGSTSGCEEAVLLRRFRILRTSFPFLRLVLAPRHPERLPKIIRDIEKLNLAYQRWSEPLPREPASILLVDRMGLLSSLYAFADVVYIGGSLSRRGGQNPIEAARCKQPILHGPHVINFDVLYRALDQNGAAFCVQSEEELDQKLRLLIRDPKLRTRMGTIGFETVQTMKGATTRTLECLDSWIRSAEPSRALVS
jgi:3-deoxy-D-manno-octulosonic-acid transferase